MKVFIPAAGLGTRLGDLTRSKPKALVEFQGKPMLQTLLERLKKQGFDEVCLNIHHFGDLILRFLEEHRNFGLSICISDEWDQLLDTGGAVKKAAGFFHGNEPVLVHNVDIYTDMDFQPVMENHKKSKALISLLVRDRVSSRKLLFDETMALKGWKNLKTGEYKWVTEPLENYKERAFSGIYVASPDFPDKINKNGSFPVVPAWLDLAKENKILGIEHNNSLWFDLGTREKIKEAEAVLSK